jgi:hypothetical protein
MKHIPTLTIIFNKPTGIFGYSYDDENGNTIVNDGHTSVANALSDAWYRLKTFLVLEDVETYE